ncbi:hypothetical protein Q9189_001975 [Teloschistes chrysophthalmus]
MPPEVSKQDRGRNLVIIIWVFGKHPFAVDPDQLPYLEKLYLISLPFAVLTLSLPPIAVAILLDRLIEPEQSQKWVLYSVPALQFIAAAVDIILLFVQCSPASNLWSPKAARAHCWKSKVLISYIYYFASIFPQNSSMFYAQLSIGYTAFTDVFLALVPIVAFWRLHLRPKAKIILYVLMSSTMILEGNAIIIATCIPGLRPFFKLLRRKYFARKRRHLPPPLILHKDLHLPSDSSALSSPISPRRMEPRGCGSVSAPVPKGPNHKAYRQKSLAPILPNPDDVEGEEFETRQEGNDIEKKRLDSGHGAEKEVKEASTAETVVEAIGTDEDVPTMVHDGHAAGS